MYTIRSRNTILSNDSVLITIINFHQLPPVNKTSVKKAFKRVLHKLLFDILDMEDDYIEIPPIIKKLGY